MNIQKQWTSFTRGVKALALPIIRYFEYAIDVKRRHYAYQSSARNAVPRTAVNSNRQAAKWPRRVQHVGMKPLSKRKTVTDSRKRSGPVGAKHPTDPATSSEF